MFSSGLYIRLQACNIDSVLDSGLSGVKSLAAAVSWLEGSMGTQGCQPQ